MWIVKRGKLVSSKKIESTYIRKDQLVSLNTQGVCQSIEVFCPETVQLFNFPWQKFQTIETKNWILRIIKLNGKTKTLSEPIALNDITTVEELYYQIIKSETTVSELSDDGKIKSQENTAIDISNQFEANNSFSNLKSDYPAQYT